jgi:hypothetical protein
MKIRLRIDRLVLDGVSVDGLRQDALREQMLSELERLIHQHGLRPEMKKAGAHAALPGADLVMEGKMGGSRLGREIARSVFKAIGEPTGPNEQVHHGDVNKQLAGRSKGR